MKLSPKGKRVLWVILGSFVVFAALGGWFTWEKLFRQEPQLFVDEADQFKYGSCNFLPHQGPVVELI